MSAPNPLLIWSCALIALAIGLRKRRPERRDRAAHLPPVLAAMAAIPLPRAAAVRARTARLQRAVLAAGLPAPTVETVARARVGAVEIALAAGAVLAVVHPAGVIVGCLAAGAGYLAPLSWAQRRAAQRRMRIVRDLPDFIDLVVICTESGMALEPAIRIAAEHLRGPLPAEVCRTLRELDLGIPRRRAYSDLAARVDAAELTGFVGALLQAEELGAPIAAALKRQGELMRSGRRQDIRDRASRTAPKVQLVVALMMVPASLLLVIGVLVIQLLGQVGAVAGGVG